MQPYGLAGGEPGGRSRNFIEIGNRREPLPGKVTMTVPSGAVIIHEQAGAGGFGDPRRGDPELVREDLLDGKISAAYAEHIHAVLLSARGALARGYRCAPREACATGRAGAGGGAPRSLARPPPPRRRPQRSGNAREHPHRRASEFVAHGLSGARMDRIAETCGANKNLIYHYFGSKEDLYLTVIEAIWAGLRANQRDEELAALPPEEAMRRLVAKTFDHFVATPELIRLMSMENIHYARNLQRSTWSSRFTATSSTRCRRSCGGVKPRAFPGQGRPDRPLSVDLGPRLFLSVQPVHAVLAARSPVGDAASRCRPASARRRHGAGLSRASVAGGGAGGANLAKGEWDEQDFIGGGDGHRGRLTWPLAGPAAAQEKMSVRLDFAPWGVQAAMHLANQNGMFKAAGLEVDVQDGRGSGNTIQLVNAGQVDVGQVQVGLLGAARAQGAPLGHRHHHAQDRPLRAGRQDLADDQGG